MEQKEEKVGRWERKRKRKYMQGKMDRERKQEAGK